MPEVIVVCEGQTEREFCKQVVAPSLHARGIYLSGTLVGKPQRKRGGIRPWQSYRKELIRLAKERADRHVAVLVDYYAMPDCWPGRIESIRQPVANRGTCIEQKLRDNLAEVFPGRFHPCIQLHEFESLLFVDPDLSALSIAIGGGVTDHNAIAQQMIAVRNESGSVEAINDSPETAPSKRLIQLITGYDKVAWGVTAAADVTLPVLRAGCPWLDRWLTRLESLAIPQQP